MKVPSDGEKGEDRCGAQQGGEGVGKIEGIHWKRGAIERDNELSHFCLG